MLVDSHCHLQHFDLEERRRVVDRAREAGVGGFLIPAVRLEEADDLIGFCDAEANVWCALGVHPHDAASWTEDHPRRLREMSAHPKVVAIGECGLDFYYDYAPRDVQERVFRAQIEIAMEVALPVVVHNRDSNDAMVAVVSDPSYAALRSDFHSFAGGSEMARDLLPLETVFGVSGMVTFPKAGNVRGPLAGIPRDRLLVETDTPYLAPVPHRGQRNEPAFLVHTAARLADELGATREEVARETSATFFRFFAKAASASG